MYVVIHKWTLLCESICDDETAYATIIIRTEGGVE
jgi:hypothetical protein